jgi:hypothetical protein
VGDQAGVPDLLAVAGDAVSVQGRRKAEKPHDLSVPSVRSTLISGVLPHGMRDHHRDLDTNLISRKVVETPQLAETHRCGGFFG